MELHQNVTMFVTCEIIMDKIILPSKFSVALKYIFLKNIRNKLNNAVHLIHDGTKQN